MKKLFTAVMLFITAFSFAQDEERPEVGLKKHYVDPTDTITRKRYFTKFNTDYIKTRIGIAKPYGILVNGYSYSQSRELDTFYISIINLNPNETIKYSWITVDAINPVEDVVCTKTLKAVGPIAYGTHGKYVFDNEFILYKSIDHVKITGIKLQYMDGTFKTISKFGLEMILQDKDFDWANFDIK